LERVRLLAVDDDPAILAIIDRIGRELQFDVECLSQSHKFMTAFVRLKPHIVSLDIMMPDVDGIELVRWLNDIEAKVSVVAISGGPAMYVGAIKKFADLKGGLHTSVVRKPFEIAELRRVFEEGARRCALTP
jgi:DNA-binding response OmpR family regulator